MSLSISEFMSLREQADQEFFKTSAFRKKACSEAIRRDLICHAEFRREFPLDTPSRKSLTPVEADEVAEIFRREGWVVEVGYAGKRVTNFTLDLPLADKDLIMKEVTEETTLRCCYLYGPEQDLQCGSDAAWELFIKREDPYDSTLACYTHVAELLTPGEINYLYPLSACAAAPDDSPA